MLHHTGDVGVLQDHALAMKWFAASRARVVSACRIMPAFRYESAIASASTATAVPARLMIMVPPPPPPPTCCCFRDVTRQPAQTLQLEKWWQESRPAVDRALVMFERVSVLMRCAFMP
jgi:hypothetical protein